MINEEHLKEEIAYLQKHKKVHSQLVAALKWENSEMLGLARDRRESLEEDVYFKSERLSLLLKWCKIVCSYYGMKVCKIASRGTLKSVEMSFAEQCFIQKRAVFDAGNKYNN